MQQRMFLLAMVLSASLGSACTLRPPDSYVHIRGMPLQKYNACLEKHRGETKETLDQLCRPYLDEHWQWSPTSEHQPKEAL